MKSLDFPKFPSWTLIGLMLAVGIVFVGFGNVDRVFWRMTAQGANLPGVVVKVRSYRSPDNDGPRIVPTVAFRDRNGAVHLHEVLDGAPRYPFKVDDPVKVRWHTGNGRGDKQSVAIAVPFQRHPVTSVVMSLFTAMGLGAWVGAIALITRRIVAASTGMRVLPKDIQPNS